MKKVSILLVSVLLLSLFPLSSNAQGPADYYFVDMVDSVAKPYTFERLKIRSPKSYVCGYVVNDTWGFSLYSMFLTKYKRKYELVLFVGEQREVRRIDRNLASQLEESVRNRLADAQKTLDNRRETNTGFVTVSDEESYNEFYVMTPTRKAEYCSWVTIMLPDSLWREEYNKFSIAIAEPDYESDDDDVLMVVEDMPEFLGGFQALSDYLRDNVKYPEACRKDSIQGRVIITFVVEKDGSICGAEVVKSVHEQLDTEALRAISTMPKWKPGKQRGKVVRVKYAIPVNFRLDGTPYLTVPKSSAEVIENKTAEIIEIVEENSYIE